MRTASEYPKTAGRYRFVLISSSCAVPYGEEFLLLIVVSYNIQNCRLHGVVKQSGAGKKRSDTLNAWTRIPG